MTATLSSPFNQKIRIAALRVVFIGLLPLILFTRPAWTGGTADLLETAGILAILLAVLGRFWTILYIGGRKNRTVPREGPYSVCRHPLYLFSTIGVVGFGLMLESVTLAVLLGGTAFAILSMTATREERFLRGAFPDYAAYAREVPRMLPAPHLFHSPARLTVDTGTLTRNARRRAGVRLTHPAGGTAAVGGGAACGPRNVAFSDVSRQDILAGR